jgi:hypothetical protein
MHPLPRSQKKAKTSIFSIENGDLNHMHPVFFYFKFFIEQGFKIIFLKLHSYIEKLVKKNPVAFGGRLISRNFLVC